jgi:predicted nucleotidyltransferase
MLSENDRLAIQNIGRKYNAKRIILFGSGCDPLTESNDIDLAVEGVSDSLFFKFYSELIFSLSMPVDLFDMKMKNKFSDLAASEGLILYG